MINKQIIIDGVDITNCIHRATNKLCGDIDPYCRCYTGSCRDINNCYYKQLKRKEQDCTRWINAASEIQRKLYKTKQTLTEIKEIAKEYEELHGFLDCSGDLILQKISEVEKCQKN